jgi:2-polyprenyl-6-methoxyphenol hydroxylase-like FAD-dependent oxidoreductase
MSDLVVHDVVIAGAGPVGFVRALDEEQVTILDLGLVDAANLGWKLAAAVRGAITSSAPTPPSAIPSVRASRRTPVRKSRWCAPTRTEAAFTSLDESLTRWF